MPSSFVIPNHRLRSSHGISLRLCLSKESMPNEIPRLRNDRREGASGLFFQVRLYNSCMPDQSRLLPLKCASCGASLEFGEGRHTCPYCRTVHIIQPGHQGRLQQVGVGLGDEHVQSGIDAFRQANFVRAADEMELAAQAGVRKFKLADVYTIQGNCYLELDLSDRARAAYEMALDVDPGCYKALVGLGITYRKRGDFENAEAYYLRALELKSGYAELHASLGALYYFQGQTERALQALEHAIKLDATCALAHANYALALAQAGRFDEAEVSARSAIAMGYRNVKALRSQIARYKGEE